MLCFKYSEKFLFFSVGSSDPPRCKSQGVGVSKSEVWSRIAALALTRAVAPDKSPFLHPGEALAQRGPLLSCCNSSSALAPAFLTCSRGNAYMVGGLHPSLGPSPRLRICSSFFQKIFHKISLSSGLGLPSDLLWSVRC